MVDRDKHTQRYASRRDVLKAGAAVAGAAGITAVGGTELAYAEEHGEVDVTIKRDEFGVPHVYAREAETRAPAFYGYGYAMARDRLFQCEMWRRYYHGTIAEVLGEGDEQDWVQFDIEARRNTAGEPSIEEQATEQLPESQRDVLEAFTEGINEYITDVREGDDREFAQGFQENGFEPDPFTFTDTAGMFVASMSWFSGIQLETLGANILDALTAQTGDRETALDIFSDANWLDDPGSPTSTVQPEEGYWPPYTDAETGETETLRPQQRIDPGTQNLATNRITGGDITVPTDAQAVHETEVERRQTQAEGLDRLGLTYKLGSYALAVHGDLTESGDALLFGGPQMDFSTPSVMYEAGLHGPDFDVAGITVAGYPFIMFGHNNNGAFTSTAGIDNCLQTFEEEITVNDDGPDTYTFRGEEIEVETVEKTVEVADGDDVTYTERFTRHGVVTQWNPEEEQAITEARSYAGRHMNCLRAFYEAQFAEDVEEYSEAARRCDYALTFRWADQDGDIGFFHLGRYPDVESVPWDTRFPADGTEHELTDDDYLRAADGEVPFSINPPAGYSAGWNNKPAPEWSAGDLNYNYSTDHRVQRMINLVERRLDREGAVDFAFIKELAEDISFIDLRSIRYKDHVLDALEDADLDGTEAAAKEELETWGHVGRADGPDDMGQYPAGFTIWDETFDNVLAEVYGPVFGDLTPLALVFHDDDYGRGALMRLLNPKETTLDVSEAADYGGGDVEAALVRAFRTAVDDLAGRFDGEPEAWRADADIDPLSTITLFGVPVNTTTAGEMAVMNRGTEEHIVQLSEEIRAENILPPGNDGYVAPDGSTGPHFDDQLPLFRDFEYKDLLFDDDEVDAATESTQELAFAVADPDDDPADDDSDDEGPEPADGADDDPADDDPEPADDTADDGEPDPADGEDPEQADDDGAGFTPLVTVGAVLGGALAWARRAEPDQTE